MQKLLINVVRLGPNNLTFSKIFGQKLSCIQYSVWIFFFFFFWSSTFWNTFTFSSNAMKFIAYTKNCTEFLRLPNWLSAKPSAYSDHALYEVFAISDVLIYLRFSQQSGVRRCVVECAFPDISKDRNPFILGSSLPKEWRIQHTSCERQSSSPIVKIISRVRVYEPG
jgi:hypothetical protein